MLELFGQSPVCDARLYIPFPKTKCLCFGLPVSPEISRSRRAKKKTTVRPRDHSPHTDESTGKHKVILRSNSEIRRDRHHRNDLTSWKQLSMPNTDIAQIPEAARPPTQDLALPSSSSHIPATQSAPSLMTQNLTIASPLSILFRQNGDQIVNVHGEPPESEKRCYLDVIRAISPKDTPNPFQFPAPQQSRRQRTIVDNERSTTNAAAPVLQLPLPAQSLSDSTDAEQPRLTNTPLNTSLYEIQVRNDGMTVIGNDTNALQIRFLTDQETKHVKLPKSSTWVPWANMSLMNSNTISHMNPGCRTFGVLLPIAGC